MDSKKALIVDDETDTCFLLKGILQQHGFKTSFVHSLEDAKAALALSVPDLIFLDNHLKDGHGIEFIPYILDRLTTPKIIIITAFDTAVDKQNAFQKGAHYFIGKPFNKLIVSQALSAIFPT